MYPTPCPVCGLNNAPSSLACARCQTPLIPSATFQPQAPPGGYPPANPYAPPMAQQAALYRPVPQGMPAGIWRENDQLVFDKSAILPDRCVRCNAPTGGLRIRQTLWWHHPAVYIAAISPLIYVVLALALRKGATVDLGVCASHVATRRRATVAGALLMVGGVLGFFAGVATDDDVGGLFALAGMIALLVGAIVLSVGRRLVRPAKIDDRYVWLRGLPMQYVAEFPPTLAPPRW